MPTSRNRLYNTYSVYVNEVTPDGLFTSPAIRRSTFKLRGKNGTQLRAYMSFQGDAPWGIRYQSVILGIRAVDKWDGPTSRTILVRAITQPWDPNRLAWNSQPASTGAYAVTATRTSFPKNALWTFDVTALLNGLAGPCYGFRITMESEDSNDRAFYGDASALELRPYLDTVWTLPPNRPQTLNPGEGRTVGVAKPVLSSEYSDYTGRSNMSALRVQISSTDNFAAPGWDSGVVSSSSPMLDLSTTSYPGLADGADAWWRIQLRDTDGAWSDWSASTSFTRHAKGVIEITNPPAAPNDVVANPRPQFRWSFTGVQKQFELTITDDQNRPAYFSGRVTSPLLEHTPPSDVLTKLGSQYTVEVKVFDDYDRANVAGDPAWAYVARTFTFNPNATASPVANFTATKDPLGRPWVTLEWTRSSSPSSFVLLQGSTVLRTDIDPADVLVSGTSYRYVYRGVPPRKDVTYSIAAMQGEIMSASNPTATVKVKPATAYLCSDDGTLYFPMTNYSNNLSLAEESSNYTVLNATESTAIYGSLRGFEGSFGGHVSANGTARTAQEYLADFLAIREARSIPMWLSWADQNIYCVVRELDFKTAVFVEGVDYVVSFTALERKKVV